MEYFLRELEIKDVEIINKWRNNPELVESLASPFRFISPDIDMKWIDGYFNQRANNIRLAITKNSRNLIGSPDNFSKNNTQLLCTSLMNFSEKSVETELNSNSAPQDNLVGVVYLINIDWIIRCAEFAIWIANPDERGKGCGYFVTNMILQHAFLDLGLNRIFLTVLSKNKHAIALYKKCGFNIEGTIREGAFKSGKFEDLFLMSLLVSDYKNNNDIT